MKRIPLVLLAALGLLFMSACSGNPISSNWPGLTADAGQAYLAAGAHVFAVDLENGRETWRFPREAEGSLAFFAPPVIAPDGQLLVGSAGTSHLLASIDLAEGDENWSFNEAKGAWVAPPLVFDGKIYAANTDGYLYVLDLNSRPAADPIEIGGALWSAPATDGSSLYITSLDHTLHIIDPLKNTVREAVDLGGAAPSSPRATADGVYVGSFNSQVEFIRPDGRQEKVADATNWIWGTPSLEGDTLYYADLSGIVFSFDLASGRQNWDAVQPDGPIVAQLLVIEDRIYAATEVGTLFALDRDSEVDWKKETGGKIYTSPVSAGELILVAPYQAEFLLAAYDEQGRLAWTFRPEE